MVLLLGTGGDENDLIPRDSIFELLESWDDKRSEERLKEILGHDKAEAILKTLKTKKSIKPKS